MSELGFYHSNHRPRIKALTSKEPFRIAFKRDAMQPDLEGRQERNDKNCI